MTVINFFRTMLQRRRVYFLGGFRFDVTYLNKRDIKYKYAQSSGTKNERGGQEKKDHPVSTLCTFCVDRKCELRFSEFQAFKTRILLMSTSHQEAYVRVASEPHEYTEAAWILTRAFAHDPCMNWFGSVKKMIPEWKDAPDYNTHPAAAKKALKKLLAFQHALVKATVLCGGFITLAIIPKTQEGGGEAIERSKKDEIIAGVTLWLRPGQPLDSRVSIRSGVWKALLGWGLTGVKVHT